MKLVVPGAPQQCQVRPGPDPAAAARLRHPGSIGARPRAHPAADRRRRRRLTLLCHPVAAACLPCPGHRHRNHRRAATARAERRKAHEKHPPAAQLGSPEEAARVRTRLISVSIPSRPVLSLGAGRRELRQPFWTSKRRTTEKGSGDDGAETARHTATTRLFQWRSIAKVPVNA